MIINILATTTSNLNIIDMILNSKGLVLLDLIILIVFSIITWYVIVYKSVSYYKSKKENALFLDNFWQGGSLEEIYKYSEKLRYGSLPRVFIAGFRELAKLRDSDSADVQNLERALNKSAMVEITKLESMLPIMATISATGPFLGLFGTVWGIMVSFNSIGVQGNTSLATVAPGIVDALVTTALGLIAAIPATIAYNYFLRKVRLHVADIETFANDFLNIAQRKFLK